MSGLFRFKGKDSLGFIKGQIYFLELHIVASFGRDKIIKQTPTIMRPIMCPYDSWENFLMNWEII